MAATYNEDCFPTVGEIVKDLCLLVGITNVNTLAIDDIVLRGFIAAGGYSSADTIRSLQRAYFFDLPEIDGSLTAVLRGGASVETITRDDMVLGSEADLETAREQGVEFPDKLHLAYQSAETDYTPTKQTSERRSADIKALSKVSIQVPINLEADEASQIVDKMHKVAWSEMQGRTKFGVSEKLAKLVPSDPVMVETSSGVFKRIRIQKTSSVDGMIQIDGVIDRISAYSSDATAPTPVDPIDPGSNLISNTIYEIMDLPVLVQSHDTLHVYVSAYGAGDVWNGAVVEQLIDTEWLERGRVTFPETMGVLAADLASHPRGIDTTNTITVTLSDDEVATITQAEFDLGGNMALVGDEIINFRDVAANGDDWDLSYLNRAAMNTFILSHSTGDRFVKLVAPTRIELSSTFLNESLTFRCYSIGNVPSASDETTFTFDGNSQIEWTPLNATKELVGADWLVSWDHYKRIGAPNDAVVSQHFLDFRVQFVESPFSFTFPTTNETLTYTEAEQIEDFGAPVADFDQILIYANNRYTGFGLPATPIEVADTWVYADLATAESSGDPWLDGNQIQITGGALFLYKSALDVSGYSGLIHKEPYGSGLGTLSALTVRTSEAAGTDPDAWTDWTDNGTGSQGVDYEYDTDSGRARLRDLTISGEARIDSDYLLQSSDTDIFRIIDDVTATTTSSVAVNSIFQAPLTAYKDASTVSLIRLDGSDDGTTTNWRVNHTDGATWASTTQSRTSSSRVWVYMKDGRWAIWFGDEATPNATGTVDREFTVDPTTVSIGYLLAGSTLASTGVSTLLLGTHVFGRMTVA